MKYERVESCIYRMVGVNGDWNKYSVRITRQAGSFHCTEEMTLDEARAIRDARLKTLPKTRRAPMKLSVTPRRTQYACPHCSETHREWFDYCEKCCRPVVVVMETPPDLGVAV